MQLYIKYKKFPGDDMSVPPCMGTKVFFLMHTEDELSEAEANIDFKSTIIVGVRVQKVIFRKEGRKRPHKHTVDYFKFEPHQSANMNSCLGLQQSITYIPG